MERHFYKVTDFEGIDSYYTSRRKAVSRAKHYYKFAKAMGYVDPMVTLHQFDLPKVSKRKLAMLLLDQYQFMCNVVQIDFLNQ
jgi:hypothetical protein